MNVVIIYWFSRLDKKTIINPKINDNNCFQYATTIPVNFKENKKDPKTVSNVNSFINNYNCEGINYPSKIKDWKRFGKNNLAIVLNILNIKNKKMSSSYFTNQSKLWKKVILLMIPNVEKEGCNYLAVKKLFTLLGGITSKHKGGFIVWIAFILIEQKTSLSLMKKYVEIKIFVEL